MTGRSLHLVVVGIMESITAALTPHRYCPADGCLLLATDQMCPACYARRH